MNVETAATQLVDRVLGGLAADLGNLKELHTNTAAAVATLTGEMRASNDRLLAEIGKLRSTEISELRDETSNLTAELRVEQFKVESLTKQVNEGFAAHVKRMDDSGKSANKTWSMILNPVVAAIVAGVMALVLRHA
jgi:predicted RNase H-like nuclease (RuvC/YqgF family)